MKNDNFQPYYAVIFTSKKKVIDATYSSMAEAMVELAQKQPGFIGYESAEEEIGITVSYWESLDSISAWKANSMHQIAQEMGKTEWYDSYKVRVALVEREYSFNS
jgi:heme-degrading monooxygenase HmoA